MPNICRHRNASSSSSRRTWARRRVPDAGQPERSLPSGACDPVLERYVCGSSSATPASRTRRRQLRDCLDVADRPHGGAGATRRRLRVALGAHSTSWSPWLLRASGAAPRCGSPRDPSLLELLAFPMKSRRPNRTACGSRYVRVAQWHRGAEAAHGLNVPSSRGGAEQLLERAFCVVFTPSPGIVGGWCPCP